MDDTFHNFTLLILDTRIAMMSSNHYGWRLLLARGNSQLAEKDVCRTDLCYLWNYVI